MIGTIVALVILQQSPGPLDAFAANYADIRGRVEFVSEAASVEGSSIDEGIWRGMLQGLRTDPMLTVVGVWECDGRTEHQTWGNPPDVLAEWEKKVAPGTAIPIRRPMEVLFDGQTAAWHKIGPSGQAIEIIATNRPPYVSHGPFHWSSDVFPKYITEQDFVGTKPQSRASSRGGRPTELAIYRKESPTHWYQAEIHYDPSVGYLPRFVRLIGDYKSDAGGSIGVGKEFYLVNATPCASGGFIPTEWYYLGFTVDNFGKSYPDYSPDTQIKLRGRVAVGHFKATNFRNIAGPVVLDQLSEVRWVSGKGGAVPLGRRSTLNLSQAVSMLGPKGMVGKPESLSASIAQAELHRFDNPPPSSRIGYVVSAVLFAIVIGVWGYRRRRKAAISLLLLVFVSACSPPQKPIVRLAGSFVESPLVYENSKNVLSLHLRLANHGNSALKILGANGGCSCRKVDGSALPASLPPGGQLILPVKFQTQQQFQAQRFLFQVETDCGVLSPTVELLALPAHSVVPGSITLSLNEGERGEFDFVHRRTLTSAGVESAVKIEIPDGIRLLAEDAKDRRVNNFPKS